MPTFTALVNGITVLERYLTKNGSVVCKYRRNAEVPTGSEGFMFSLEESQHVIYAYGASLQSNGYPAYHGPDKYSFTAEKVDLKVLSVPTV